MDFSAVYGSLDEAEAALRAQGHALGFDLAIKERFPRGAGRDEVTRVNYRCAKGRTPAARLDEAIHDSKKRKTSTQMTSCEYKINLKRVPGAGWKLEPVRTRGSVATDKSTKRLPSAFEITEAEEAQDARPPPSTAPARVSSVPDRDPYEAGTAMPRRSGQFMARLEIVDDLEAELDLIPADFEGKFDEKVAEAEEAARQATQDTQELPAL